MNFPHIIKSSLLFHLLTLLPIVTDALPVRYSIVRPQKECLYTPVSSGEFITTSFFILEGDMKARMTIQGPIAPSKISSSAEVLAAALRFDKSGRDLKINEDRVVDFESIYAEDSEEEVMSHDDDYYMDDDAFDMDDMDDALFEEYYYMDDDDEYEFMEDDTMDDVEITEIRKQKAERDGMSHIEKEKMKQQRKDEKKKRFEMMKKKREESKKNREEHKDAVQKRKADQKERMMDRQKDAEEKHKLRAGEAYERTFQIEKEGWYRLCLEPTDHGIEVEMELRKSSEVGKPNTKTGHLQTHEHHDMIQLEKRLMKRMEHSKKDKMEEANGIKVEDLHSTKQHVTKLTKLLYEIKETQRNERHRLSAHKAVNEHSHSRMVLNSLFETIFYIIVSGFQVYTIRKWFSGAPILGY